MRYRRISMLIAVLLALSLLLASCGTPGMVAPKDVMEKGADYAASAVYTHATKLPLSKGTIFEAAAGELVYFTEDTGAYRQHHLYHIGTGSPLHTFAEEMGVSYEITLSENRVGGYSFFLVEKTETLPDGSGTAVTTQLYDERGTRIATVDGSATAKSMHDLLFFDGAFYENGEDGLSVRVSYSPLAAVPQVVAGQGEYYYGWDASSKTLTVYGKELNTLSRYRLPSYALGGAEDGEIFWHVLGNGNILLQYYYRLHEQDTRYTALAEIDGDLVPIRIVTEIIDAKSGKAKEVESKYLFAYTEAVPESAGLRADIATSYLYATPIENKYLMQPNTTDPGTLLFLDERGGIREISLDGERVLMMMLVAENRYVVRTSRNIYLLDETGAVLGDITNCEGVVGEHILGDGVIYDLSLRSVLDLREEGMEIVARVSGVLFLENEEGALYRLSADSDTPTLLIDGDDDSYRVHTYLGNIGYLVYDRSGYTPRYSFRNVKGVELLTVTASDLSSAVSPRVVYATETVQLLSLNDSFGRPIYYLFK